MTSWKPSRRALLKTSAISAAGTVIGAAQIVRADPKEVVVGAPPARRNISRETSFRSSKRSSGLNVIYEGMKLTDQPEENER